MRINTPPTNTLNHVSPNKRPSVKSERSVLGNTLKNIEKNHSLNSMPISKSELASLAADYKNGVIGKEEANKRFITAVINNSIAGKLGEKDREEIIDCLREFFSSDPNFEAELSKNLNDFA